MPFGKVVVEKARRGRKLGHDEWHFKDCCVHESALRAYIVQREISNGRGWCVRLGS